MRTLEEIQKLYDENEMYVEATVYKRFNKPKFLQAHGLMLDDLMQHGRIGLYKACETYDASKGSKFRTYAIDMIAWTISNECKKESLGKDSSWTFDLIDKMSLDEVVVKGGAKDQLIELHDTIASPIDSFELAILEDSLVSLERQTSKRISDIVRFKLDGYSNKDVAEILGCTHQWISNLLRENKKTILRTVVAS